MHGHRPDGRQGLDASADDVEIDTRERRPEVDAGSVLDLCAVTILVPPTSTRCVASHDEKKTPQAASATTPTPSAASSHGRAVRSRRAH